MITVYTIILNVYRDDLMEIIGYYPAPGRIKTTFTAGDTAWNIQSPHIELSGTFKGKRLRIHSVKPKTIDGVEILKRVAKLCKGTIVAVVNEPTRQALYITKGQEELDASLLDIQGEKV